MTLEIKTSDWEQPAPGATVRTTCPYCGVGCGVLAAPPLPSGVARTPQPTPQ